MKNGFLSLRGKSEQWFSKFQRGESKMGFYVQEVRVNNGFPFLRGESEQWVSIY